MKRMNSITLKLRLGPLLSCLDIISGDTGAFFIGSMFFSFAFLIVSCCSVGSIFWGICWESLVHMLFPNGATGTIVPSFFPKHRSWIRSSSGSWLNGICLSLKFARMRSTARLMTSFVTVLFGFERSILLHYSIQSSMSRFELTTFFVTSDW